MEIRTVADDELRAFRDALMTTFGDEADTDPQGNERLRALIDPSQVWAVFDGSTIVGTAATFVLDVIVPGGATLPMAGLTMVIVRPTHRRRGLLRRLIDTHLEDARTRGLPVSGLWASEAGIYGRFGYGLAIEADAVTIDRAHQLVFDAREFDELEWLEEAQARDRLPPIYARAIEGRPGALSRSATWWRERRFHELPWHRAGASKRRHIVARRGDRDVGYLAFRHRTGWQDGLATGKVEINELLAIDPRAEATLWRFAASIDLFPTVTYWNAPTDSAIAWLVGDPRRVVRRRTDALWLRIDDVARTLEARRYEQDGELSIRVDDAAWTLSVSDGCARCVPAERGALEMSRATLGALYLGGVSASRLARAGRITGDARMVTRADHVFASSTAPWCVEQF